MMTKLMRLLTLLGAVLALAACGGVGENAPSVTLPLAKDKPTFLFFFTDG
ncbi:MAG: hypothetical protein R3E39_22255 [Anaerolineae bacterium]